MTTSEVVKIDRAALIKAEVTLDGQPALICGRLLEFPSVVELSTGRKVEFSWAACAHVVAERGGRFRS